MIEKIGYIPKGYCTMMQIVRQLIILISSNLMYVYRNDKPGSTKVDLQQFDVWVLALITDCIMIAHWCALNELTLAKDNLCDSVPETHDWISCVPYNVQYWGRWRGVGVGG